MKNRMKNRNHTIIEKKTRIEKKITRIDMDIAIADFLLSNCDIIN